MFPETKTREEEGETMAEERKGGGGGVVERTLIEGGEVERWAAMLVVARKSHKGWGERLVRRKLEAVGRRRSEPSDLYVGTSGKVLDADARPRRLGGSGEGLDVGLVHASKVFGVLGEVDGDGDD